MEDFSALAQRIAVSIREVRGCLILSRDGMVLGAYPDEEEDAAKSAWLHFCALGEPERSFVEFSEQTWAFVRRGPYAAFAVAEAGVRPGIMVDQLEQILVAAEDGRVKRGDTFKLPDAASAPSGKPRSSLHPSSGKPEPSEADQRKWSKSIPQIAGAEPKAAAAAPTASQPAAASAGSAAEPSTPSASATGPATEGPVHPQPAPAAPAAKPATAAAPAATPAATPAPAAGSSPAPAAASTQAPAPAKAPSPAPSSAPAAPAATPKPAPTPTEPPVPLKVGPSLSSQLDDDYGAHSIAAAAAMAAAAAEVQAKAAPAPAPPAAAPAAAPVEAAAPQAASPAPAKPAEPAAGLKREPQKLVASAPEAPSDADEDEDDEEDPEVDRVMLAQEFSGLLQMNTDDDEGSS
jgi:hypothetical protein